MLRYSTADKSKKVKRLNRLFTFFCPTRFPFFSYLCIRNIK
nr:MAG TPA: hypothetical protein [Caudoviricetes sp.]